MPLIDLPLEIFLDITAGIWPEDLTNLACTCRRIHELCQERLVTHQALLQEWSSPVLSSTAITHPVKVLRAIWETPAIALYIRKLTYFNQRRLGPWRTNAPILSEDVLAALHTLDDGRVLLRESEYINTMADIESFSEAIGQGYQVPAVALLLSLLPNVTQLDLILHPDDYSLLLKMLRNICSASSQSDAGSVLRPPALGRLDTVNFYHVDGVGARRTEPMLAFATLPSVRKMIRNGMDEEHRRDNVQVSPGAYNVEEVLWYNAQVTPHVVRSFLRPMHALRKLELVACVWGQSEWKNTGVFEALGQEVGERLEVLRIQCWGRPARVLTSFHAFPRLKHLTTESQLLEYDIDRPESPESSDASEVSDDGPLQSGVATDSPDHSPRHSGAEDDGEGSQEPDIADLLPDSLESLTIEVTSGPEQDFFCRLFASLKPAKDAGKLPLFKNYCQAGRWVDKPVRQALKDSNVTLSRIKTLLPRMGARYRPGDESE